MQWVTYCTHQLVSIRWIYIKCQKSAFVLKIILSYEEEIQKNVFKTRDEESLPIRGGYNF